jgi:hypothetical protein
MTGLTDSELDTLKKVAAIFSHVEIVGCDAARQVQEQYEREARISGDWSITPELERNRTMRLANVRNIMSNLIVQALLPKLPTVIELITPPTPTQSVSPTHNRNPNITAREWWKMQSAGFVPPPGKHLEQNTGD